MVLMLARCMLQQFLHTEYKYAKNNNKQQKDEVNARVTQFTSVISYLARANNEREISDRCGTSLIIHMHNKVSVAAAAADGHLHLTMQKANDINFDYTLSTTHTCTLRLMHVSYYSVTGSKKRGKEIVMHVLPGSRWTAISNAT